MTVPDQRSTFDYQNSTFEMNCFMDTVQRSTFTVQHSTFKMSGFMDLVQRSMLNVEQRMLNVELGP